MSSTPTYAYLYRWTQLSTGRWYVGSRTARGCHPDDGYICSSKSVKPMILENRADWQREILCIGEPMFIKDLEGLFLQSVDAALDVMSFNQHNNNKVYSRTGCFHSEDTKRVLSNKGQAFWTPERRIAQSLKYKGRPAANKGTHWSEEAKLALRLHREAHPLSEETRAKMAKANRQATNWQICHAEGTFVVASLRKFCRDRFGERWRSALSLLAAGYSFSGCSATKMAN